MEKEFCNYTQSLSLKELGLKSAVVLPLGYRDKDNDNLQTMKKVRRNKETFFIKK